MLKKLCKTFEYVPIYSFIVFEYKYDVVCCKIKINYIYMYKHRNVLLALKNVNIHDYINSSGKYKYWNRISLILN